MIIMFGTDFRAESTVGDDEWTKDEGQYGRKEENDNQKWAERERERERGVDRWKLELARYMTSNSNEKRAALLTG